MYKRQLQPLQKKEIPLFVKSFKNPLSNGTVISKGVDINPLVPCYIFKENLILLKISSLESDDKKKKFKYKLIPVSTFQSQVFKSHLSKITAQKKSKPIADINLTNFETSTLSLKSIEKEKDVTDISSNIEKADYNLEKNITHKEIADTWDEYVDIEENKGRYNIASILRISEPKFKDDTIIYSVPNNTAAIEFEQEKQQLILFIRRKLNSKINISSR